MKLPFFLKGGVLVGLGIFIWSKTRQGDAQAHALIMLLYCAVAVRLVSRDFVHFPGWFLRLSARLQDGKLQGKLYMFDQNRVHLYLVGDEAWIAADGIKQVLHPTEQELMMLKGYQPIPGTKNRGLSETVLFQLLAKRQRVNACRETTRFEHWLRHEALPNLRRFPSSSQ